MTSTLMRSNETGGVACEKTCPFRFLPFVREDLEKSDFGNLATSAPCGSWLCRLFGKVGEGHSFGSKSWELGKQAELSCLHTTFASKCGHHSSELQFKILCCKNHLALAGKIELELLIYVFHSRNFGTSVPYSGWNTVSRDQVSGHCTFDRIAMKHFYECCFCFLKMSLVSRCQRLSGTFGNLEPSRLVWGSKE